MSDLVLGVDTSNYTTSICAVDAATGQLAAEARLLLTVNSGERGLRQSDALFFHVRQLPVVVDQLLTELRATLGECRWVAVGVSVRPRPFCESYMPVFRAGESFAMSFGRALGIPVIRTSHQEGHLAAAHYFVPVPPSESFLALHLSGGTSDVVVAKQTRFGYRIESVAEGADLHAGQFVDRVGVALGLPFPAGPHLESLARSTTTESSLRLPVSLVGGRLSFAGPCSAALRAIEQGVPGPDVARAVETSIANAVVKAVQAAHELHPYVQHAVVAGGVASNQFIQARVKHRLSVTHPSLEVHFAPPRFASDNALGPARIAWGFLQH